MLRSILVVVAAGWAGGAWAQEPPQLKLPGIKGVEERLGTTRPSLQQTTTDQLANYSNRHEAAVAAFQAGYKAFSVEHNRDRATRLFLVALHRDPDYAKALYNVGVLCAGYERWQDALSFYNEARQKGPDPQLAKSIDAEIERVQAITQMEGAADGKKRRQFDSRLLEILSKTKDPIAGANSVNELARLDPSRWEAPALAGIYHADAGEFPDSIKSLEEAARLAPAARRLDIQSAAGVARSESTFAEQKNNADGFWEKQQYESAAKLYASAWENSPGRLDVAMEAATGFLMADQVSLAVQILARMRDYAPAEMDVKLVAMLKELGAVSEPARNEAAQQAHASAGESSQPAARIRSLVGALTTPRMELAARQDPPLAQDATRVIPVPDDELTAPSSDMGLLATDSVFRLYRKNLPSTPSAAEPPAANPPLPAAPPASAASSPLAAPPAATEPPEPPAAPGRPSRLSSSPTAPAIPPPARPAAAVKAGSAQSISSNPPGASVVFDDNPSLTCVTPCEIPLAAGRHTFKATMAGHRDVLKIFNVDKKLAPIEIALETKRGSLLVESAIAGSAIFLNGKKTDRVTPAQLTLDEGEWEVGVDVGGTMSVQKVPVKDGGLLKVTF